MSSPADLVAAFEARFPEMAGLDRALLMAHIGDAQLEIDAELFAAKADVATLFLAAHKIASSPMGQATQLADPKGRTTYFQEYDRIRRQVSYGYRVI